jgi:diguanylate cyclase (GGDEF)-like protein
MLAIELLERVRLSMHDDMALYDQNDELIAFASRQPDGYELGYLSFVAASPVLFKRREFEREFQSGMLPMGGNLASIHVAYGSSEKSASPSQTTYVRLIDKLVIKSHQNVFDAGSTRRIAHLELSHVLDDSYFAKLSKDMDVSLKQTFGSPLASQALTMSSQADIEALSVSQTPEQYLAVMQKSTPNGPVYFTVALDKTRENALVNTQRLQMLLILMAIAACLLMFMRSVLQRSLARPLDRLMGQIRQIKQGNYAELPALATGDELEEIAQSVNTLASTVAQREAALELARGDEAHRANHDALTGLPNRRFFAQRLDDALVQAQTSHRQMAVVYLDVDQFKVVNDTLGHGVGDLLLAQIAQRLQTEMRSTDTLARLGGDEYTVLLDDVADAAEVAHRVAQYLALFKRPFACGEHNISTTASMGVAMYPQDGQTGELLLKHADLALYKAKDSGRDNCSFFSADLSDRVSRRAEMTQALKRAIEAGNQFVLYYQPKVSAASGQIVAAEALIRWQSPDFGFVPPASFIGLAEESRQIIAIGDWVIAQGCRDLASLNAQGIALDHLSMNVSSVQLRHHDVRKVLQQAIDQNGLSAGQLEIEITESYLAQDSAQAIESLHAFRAMGMQLAIDDFGTGYSSLSYLKKLPFTRVKIDKSFVDGLPGDADSVAVTRAIIGLAQNFGLHVTAEGVEHADQFAFLQQAQCDEIQGYLFARPMPLAEFMAFCRHHQVLSQKTL